MGENDQVTTFNIDPAANAPDAAAADKGKGKAVEDRSATQEMSMDEDEESEESENEDMVSPPFGCITIPRNANICNFLGP